MDWDYSEYYYRLKPQSSVAMMFTKYYFDVNHLLLWFYYFFLFKIIKLKIKIMSKTYFKLFDILKKYCQTNFNLW